MPGSGQRSHLATRRSPYQPVQQVRVGFVPRCTLFHRRGVVDGKVTRTATGVEFFSAEEKALFRTPAPGEIGSDRNMFTGPGFFQFDLGLFKKFSLDDRRRLELRMEVFNLFDTVNFSQPTATLSSATFGNINGTRIPPRTIQLGAKMYV